MLEIEYEFREEDLIHFNEQQLERNEDVQNHIKKNRWFVPGIMFLIGSFYYFYYGDRNSAAYIIAIALLWAWLSPRVMMLDFRRQILKNYTHKEKADMFGTYTLGIDPANPKYLFEKSPSGKHKMAWSDLVRIERGKKYVFIYVDLSTALVIPLETMKKGDLKEFANQVETMLERFG
ncbi:MAG: YcxB family protein [Methylococcales bacterium]|nr:YcxB family protein [Methylococcaceae bacterium]